MKKSWKTHALLHVYFIMSFAKTHILRGIFPHARAPLVKLRSNFTSRVFFENSQIIVYELSSSATEIQFSPPDENGFRQDSIFNRRDVS